MTVVDNYKKLLDRQTLIDYVKNHPSEFGDFEKEHTELFVDVNPSKYTLLSEKGKILKSYVKEEDGTYKDTTELEKAKQEVELAEAELHRQLRKELLERQREAQEANNA